MFEKLCNLIENALEWSETLIDKFNVVAFENGLDADDDFDVIVELIAEELSVQISLDINNLADTGDPRRAETLTGRGLRKVAQKHAKKEKTGNYFASESLYLQAFEK